MARGIFLLVLLASLPAIADTLTDAQVRKQMIAESVASYPGNCPCPYNLASNGSQCGKRSAYSKPGDIRRYAIRATSAMRR